MAHPAICPVCKGIGKISSPASVTVPDEVTCHGCFGKGWVEVHDASDWPPSYSIVSGFKKGVQNENEKKNGI